jgi:hypothetical protein
LTPRAAKPQRLWSARTCPRFWQATCRRRVRKVIRLTRAAGRDPALATSRQSGKSGDESSHSRLLPLQEAARAAAKFLYSRGPTGFTAGQHQPDRLMEIKIFCNCSAKYKFDVEPVNSQMPRAVVCPVCGADGTAQANQIIRQNQTAPVAEPLGMPAPRPPSPGVPQAIRLPSSPVVTPAAAAPPPPPLVVRAAPGSATGAPPPLPPAPGSPPAIRIATVPAGAAPAPPPPPIVRAQSIPSGTTPPPPPPPPAAARASSSRSGYWMPAMPPVASSSKHPSSIMFDPPPIAAKSGATGPVPPPLQPRA